MNLKELKESLNEAKDAKKALLSKAVEEVRSLDCAEDDELRSLDEKISNLQKQIKEAEEEIRSRQKAQIQIIRCKNGNEGCAGGVVPALF